MSQMARKLALTRKAILQIRKIEDYLEANKNNLPESELVLGMKETRDYAVIVANSVREAIAIMRSVQSKAATYQESIQDAIN
jgi:hypothetical protein